jgi:hypothetical protein
MRGSSAIHTVLFSIALLAGCAGTSPPPPAAAASNQAASTPVTCMRETGTLIKPRTPGECLNQPGRSYDRDAIDSTGATNMGDALRNLDPSITTH